MWLYRNAISCGPGPSGTSSCSNRLPPLIAPAACVRAVDVVRELVDGQLHARQHREDEGPAGEVGIAVRQRDVGVVGDGAVVGEVRAPDGVPPLVGRVVGRPPGFPADGGPLGIVREALPLEPVVVQGAGRGGLRGGRGRGGGGLVAGGRGERGKESRWDVCRLVRVANFIRLKILPDDCARAAIIPLTEKALFVQDEGNQNEVVRDEVV